MKRLLIFYTIITTLFFLKVNLKAQNTSYPYSAGYSGNSNTCIGAYSGTAITGNDNSLLGAYSGPATSGNANVFLGSYSGNNITGAMQSVFIGSYAGYSTTTGYYNTFIGRKSGYSNNSGIGNTYSGHWSGYFNTHENYNLFLGYMAGMRSRGDRNVFIGNEAGKNDTTEHTLIINTSAYNPLIYGEFDNDMLSVGGRLGIGIRNVPDTIQLAVNGIIVAKEGIITVEHFPDYVFYPNYERLKFQDLRKYISKNRHLPEIPSAKSVEKEGIKVGEMQKLLLKKIEELTLYMIEIQNENEQLMKRIAQIKNY